MEEEYWERFLKTGEIRDYLYYKGMAICKKVIDSYESGGSSESDCSDRHGACGGTCR
ncbi:MAG: hypothetical protein HFG94_01900 [Dorea sp.]|nr:hypothetical protein [Dorea sp.]MCI9615199.1 hypothetical protein [Dorea sp.]MDE7037202.1 hypothetical protein [Lachnospiraceae bacterium]